MKSVRWAIEWHRTGGGVAHDINTKSWGGAYRAIISPVGRQIEVVIRRNVADRMRRQLGVGE